MTHNPWKVDSLQAFSCLKCPECPFFTKEENSFANHAIANHPLSKILFDYNVNKKNAVVNFEIVSNDFFNQLEVLDPSTEEKTPIQASLKRKRKDYSTGGNKKKRGNNLSVMVIRVVEFSSRGYKIRKIFA